MKTKRMIAVICLTILLLCVSGCAVQPSNAVTGSAPTPLFFANGQGLFMNAGPHSASGSTFYCYDGSSISSLGSYDYTSQDLYRTHALIHDRLYLANGTTGILQVDTSTKEITPVPLFGTRVYSVAALNNQLVVLTKAGQDDYKLSLWDPISLQPVYTSPTAYGERTTGTPLDICASGENIYVLLEHVDSSNSILKLDHNLEPVCEISFDGASGQIPTHNLRFGIYGDCIFLYGSRISTVGLLQDDTITPLLTGADLIPAVQFDQSAAPVFYDTEKNSVHIYEPTSKTLTETPLQLEKDTQLVSAAASADHLLLFVRQEDPDPLVFDFIYVPMIIDRNLSALAE